MDQIRKKNKSKKSSQKNIWRLLDANLNRAREGLRVLEDTARFVWEDEKLFSQFRRARHTLDQITRAQYPKLLDSRNSQADCGRVIKESLRLNLDAILAANFRRCEEALRVLEEYSKLFSQEAATEFKAIRFQMYTLEKVSIKKLTAKTKGI